MSRRATWTQAFYALQKLPDSEEKGVLESYLMQPEDDRPDMEKVKSDLHGILGNLERSIPAPRIDQRRNDDRRKINGVWHGWDCLEGWIPVEKPTLTQVGRAFSKVLADHRVEGNA